MQKTTILIVEDDKDLSEVIRAYLESEQYHIVQVENGNEVIESVKNSNPTLILLDIMLPEIGGITLCRSIREYTHCPIIMISAKKSESDKLLSFGMGADDYMTKPFSFVELLGRVKSHIRRYTSFRSESKMEHGESEKVFGTLVIKSDSYIVEANGHVIDFTSREFQLLEFLASNPSQVFTKKQLLECVWGESEYIDENTITVYIGRVREKLSKEDISYIKTVWGVGYKWEV